MGGLKRADEAQKLLSRHDIGELGALQASVQKLATHRGAALRLLMVSRNTTTLPAQREFWLEFSWVDQEYRAAVRELALFCAGHRNATVTSL